MPYSVTKAAQLHLMRCLASTQGPRVRVNAVLPGWLDTEWVSCGFKGEGRESAADEGVNRASNIRKRRLRLWRRELH